MNKFNTVFGDNSAAMKTWSDDFAGSVGRSKQQIADFVSSSQDLLVPIGFDASSATEISKQITALAVDLASFNNTADADAQRDLQAALTGSGEVMIKYGVIVSEAAVKAELLKNGLEGDSVSEQAKVQARLAIIMRGTTAAQGDAIRSAGGYANQMKALQANVSDAAVAIGSALLPVITPLVSKVSAGVKIFSAFFEKNSELVGVVAKVALGVALAGAGIIAIGTAFVFVGAAISGAVTVLGAVGSVVGAIASAIAFLVSPIGIAMAAVAGLAAYFIYASGAAGDAVDFVKEVFSSLAGDATAAFGAISKALAAGDIAAAAAVLWAVLRLEWNKGTAYLNDKWQEWKTFFYNIANNVTSDVAGLFIDMAAGIQTAFNDAFAFILKRSLEVTNELAKALIAAEEAAHIITKDQAEKLKFTTVMATKLLGNKVDKDTAESNAEIAAGQAGAKAALEEDRARQEKRNFKGQADSLAADLSAVAKARAEFEAAVAAADAMPMTARLAGGKGAPALGKLPTADAMLHLGKVASQGTFDASAVAGLAAGNAADRTAKATEETAKEVKQIRKTGGLSFT